MQKTKPIRKERSQHHSESIRFLQLTIVVGEVSSLAHESGDDTMETVLIVIA
jgi:hypothetical protein